MTATALRLVLLVALTAALAAAVGTARADAAPPQAPAANACTLVSFSLGAIEVNAAGQVIVHVDPIGANVQLTGLVGTIVCPLLGGFTPPAPAPAP